MREIRYWAVVLIVACGTVLGASRTHYVEYGDANWANMIGPPPVTGSAEQKGEIGELLKMQSQRTEAQEKRCKAEVHVNGFYFAKVLGSHFNEHELPITGELLKSAAANATVIDDELKRHWDRTRPYLADPRIRPCVALEKASSYPSGHAVRGMLWATVLGEIFPEKKAALLALGRQIGNDRVIAGVHYPSDVAAGQKLGAAIAKQMLGNTEFKKELEKVREECMAEVH